mmetsp:Transcript_18607/g.53106  ORF Transcript_18607/g.53106 Transcript_18607/m.53106 type:complete len:297 (+) Transcript_18607:76-966(+)
MMISKSSIACLLILASAVTAFVPLIDGGKQMPRVYEGWFDDQIAKQAATAVGKAIAAGKTKIEVNFPPVPNVDEVKFGTPLNQKFGKTIISKDLNVPYKPGSDLSRQLIGYSNIYWAKKIGQAAAGGNVGNIGGKPVCVLTTEPISFNDIKNKGIITRTGAVMSQDARRNGRNGEAIICVNPGGEETWDRLVSAHASPGAPFVVLNNAYSTTYNLGNKRGYEEAYYLKRISKGWVYRAYPGQWQAYLEKPDGKVELLKSYASKPELRDVANLVREESFKRFAINNDRWTPGFGERL